MMLKYILCLGITLPFMFCQHIVEQNVTTNISTPYKHIGNSTKIMSEGGIIVLNDTASNISNVNSLSIPEANGGVKKISSVVRKNGVSFTPEELAALNATKNQQVQDKTPHPHTNQYPKGTNESNENPLKSILITSLHPVETATNKPIVHKPLILSSEALSKIALNSQLSSLPIVVKASSKTMADQLPAPDGNTLSSKIYTMNTGKNPGMIMPIVITIFVVPMFAVLGYLAVKRGQEAWRNRHYKRMDFLLDGMYND